MKDNRSLYLLIFALIIVTVAFILISIWGYHFYFQPKGEKTISQSIQKNPLAAKKIPPRDSLQNLLDSAIQQLATSPGAPIYNNSDSIDKILELKLIEFNELKNEIAEILKNKSSKNISAAAKKIAELQKEIDSLRNQSEALAAENTKLNEALKKLAAENPDGEKKLDPKKSIPKKITSLPLLVTHLKFDAISENEKVTKLASQANKLTGSFQINIYSDKNNSSKIFILILQPDGKVLLNPSGESATFQTTSGKKIYSSLIHFDVAKDNKKRLKFSINLHPLQKGKYIMQIYHNEIMIGRLVRTLY